MTDTECKRTGYDDTGRYHVPEADMCPECRAAPGRAHSAECEAATHEGVHVVSASGSSRTVSCAPPVPRPGITPAAGIAPDVPFAVQEFIFEELAGPKLDDLDVCLFAKHYTGILALARERLRSGYKAYGSRMYGWTPQERLRNVMEEIADAVVYLTSGPID